MNDLKWGSLSPIKRLPFHLPQKGSPKQCVHSIQPEGQIWWEAVLSWWNEVSLKAESVQLMFWEEKSLKGIKLWPLSSLARRLLKTGSVPLRFQSSSVFGNLFQLADVTVNLTVGQKRPLFKGIVHPFPQLMHSLSMVPVIVCFLALTCGWFLLRALSIAFEKSPVGSGWVVSWLEHLSTIQQTHNMPRLWVWSLVRAHTRISQWTHQ